MWHINLVHYSCSIHGIYGSLAIFLHKIFQRRLSWSLPILSLVFHVLVLLDRLTLSFLSLLIQTMSTLHFELHHQAFTKVLNHTQRKGTHPDLVLMITCLSVYSIKHLDKYIWGGCRVSRSARWITITAISPSSALFSASNVLVGALLVLVGNHSLKCPMRVSEGSFPHAPRVPCPTRGVCKCLTIDGSSESGKVKSWKVSWLRKSSVHHPQADLAARLSSLSPWVRIINPWCCDHMVWHGIAWHGVVWYGMVWYCIVWYGMIWYDMVRYGMIWYDMVWYGMMWYDMGHLARITLLGFAAEERHSCTVESTRETRLKD